MIRMALRDEVNSEIESGSASGPIVMSRPFWPQSLNAVHHRLGRIGSTEDHVCATRCGQDSFPVADNFIRARDHGIILFFIGGVQNRDCLRSPQPSRIALLDAQARRSRARPRAHAAWIGPAEPAIDGCNRRRRSGPLAHRKTLSGIK